MAANPNKLTQFWQELKRRKVVRVVTVYAAAAFVILELTDIVAPSMGLPDWTLNLIIILLCVGFIIAVLLSWIYDIHPEGGIIKTEPTHKVKNEDISKSSNSWKIASYIIFAVIVGLILLNIIPHSGKKEILDKSIAVLPFLNDSPEETEMFFVNGTMESILDNLCKIEDLRVVSRTSVEQYRNNPKPIPTVGKEMNVSYIVEGSGLKHGNKIRMTIQLVDAVNDKHLWSKIFTRNASEIFELQSEIAQKVAKEIEAVITPEEKQLIEKVPTTSLASNDLYLHGREEYVRFLVDIHDSEALLQARDYYYMALEYDSTFAKAYAGLAMTYFSELVRYGYAQTIYFEGYLDNNAFEPVLQWANRALYFDDQLSDAYAIRARYYHETGQRERAENDYNMAIALNPNQWDAYQGMGDLYMEYDYVKALEYYNKASSGLRGPELSLIVDKFYMAYMLAGLYEEAESLRSEYVNLNIDSVTYYTKLAWIEYGKQNYDRQYEYHAKAYAFDSLNPFPVYYITTKYLNQGNYEKALEYYGKCLHLFRKTNILPYNLLHRIGFTYAKAGYPKEADFYFDQQEEYSKVLIDLNRPVAQTSMAYYDLAIVYALRDWKDETLETLRFILQGPFKPMITLHLLQGETLFDSLRDEPEFKQILHEADILYRSEQERIRQLLEENDML